MGSIVSSLSGIASDFIAQDANARAYQNNSYQLLLTRQQARAAAVDSLARGVTAAGRVRMGGSALLAKQRVAFANSGVDTTVGTPAEVAAGSATFNEFDALTVENNAAREALGHTRTAQRIDAQRAQMANDFEQSNIALGVRFAGRAIGFAGGAADLGSALNPKSAIDKAFDGY